MGTGIPSRRPIGRDVNLITYLYLVPKLIIIRAVNPPSMFDLFAWTGTSPFYVGLRFPV